VPVRLAGPAVRDPGCRTVELEHLRATCHELRALHEDPRGRLHLGRPHRNELDRALAIGVPVSASCAWWNRAARPGPTGSRLEGLADVPQVASPTRAARRRPRASHSAIVSRCSSAATSPERRDTGCRRNEHRRHPELHRQGAPAAGAPPNATRRSRVGRGPARPTTRRSDHLGVHDVDHARGLIPARARPAASRSIDPTWKGRRQPAEEEIASVTVGRAPPRP
jgi:hypothetical protein